MQQIRHSIDRPRSGFTLIEVMLVVAIIFAMTSLAWTPLVTAWSDHRLSAATEDVRSILAGTRIQSLENDAVWQFRFEPGGTRFVRVPHQSQQEADGTATDGRMSLTLPEGITFGDDNSTSTTATKPLSSADISGLPDSGELSGIAWSQPILFFPDGTSMQATMQVVDEENGGERTLTVRDLTGGVTVARTDNDEEL